MHKIGFISVFTVFVLLSTTLFAVSFSNKSYLTGQSPQAIVSADINRDGHPDLIVADSDNTNGSNGFITVLLGSSNGTFTINSNLPTTRLPIALVAGDFNSDGYPDVVALEGGRFQLFLSSKNGTLIPQEAVALGGNGGSIVAVDLNGDHVPDLALTYFGLSSGNLKTLLNDGTGHFTPVQTISVSSGLAGALVTADFDRDSHDDLAVADGDAVRIFHSNNNGTLTQRDSLIVPDNIGAFGLPLAILTQRTAPILFSRPATHADRTVFSGQLSTCT